MRVTAFERHRRDVAPRRDGTPYASVILPVHEREETLPFALASVQDQSVREIEIVVAGDGVTERVREIVATSARADPRIRFLDLPKAAGRGEANRDLAVRVARSERIFYIDDDDVFLRDHVETLGPALDSADFVESLPATGRSGGRVAVGFTNTGSELVRELLVTWKLKLNFDTHVAHTATAYRRLPHGWSAHPAGRPVWRLFTEFADLDGMRWGVIPRVTSISLHSPPRSWWSDADRREEIRGWLKRSRSGATGRELLVDADWVPHGFRLFRALPPAPEDTFERYLDTIGLSLGDAGDAGPDRVVVPVPPPERRRLEALVEFLRGRLRDRDMAADLLRSLTEPLLGPNAQLKLLEKLLAANLGTDGAAEVLRQVTRGHEPSLDLRAMRGAEQRYELIPGRNRRQKIELCYAQPEGTRIEVFWKDFTSGAGKVDDVLVGGMGPVISFIVRDHEVLRFDCVGEAGHYHVALVRPDADAETRLWYRERTQSEQIARSIFELRRNIGYYLARNPLDDVRTARLPDDEHERRCEEAHAAARQLWERNVASLDVPRDRIPAMTRWITRVLPFTAR